MQTNNLNLIILFPFLFSFLFCSKTNEIDDVDKFITVKKVDERVIVVGLASDAVTAIKTDDGMVVIDAGISPTLTAKYKKIIEKEFKTTNFIYLINTHSHHDHIAGNQIFSEATIIGHQNILTDIKKQPDLTANLKKASDDYDKKMHNLKVGTDEWNRTHCQKLRYFYAYTNWLEKNIAFCIDTTFNEQMNISLADLTFELFYFGKAHSNSDIIIYVKELKLLFTGDLFSQFGRPSIYDDLDSRCYASVKELKKKLANIETIITGHGEILTKDDLQLFIEKIENWEAK